MDNIWAILLILVGIIGAFFGGSYLLEKLGNANQPDGGLSEPEKATITLTVEPNNFNPANTTGEKVKITVKTDKRIEAKIYLTEQIETSTLQYYLPPQGSVIGLAPNNDTQGYIIEWDGKNRNTNKFFKPGNYRAVVTESGGSRAEQAITISGIVEGLGRDSLKTRFPWPKEIVVGLSEINPTVKLSITIVNPNDFPAALSDVSNFFPPPREITFEGVETGKISKTSITQDPEKIEPYKMGFTIDYSDYFKQPFIQQKTIHGTIKVKQGGLFPEAPEIPLTIHLNESGAILYKKGDKALDGYMEELAEEKGWKLIGVEGEPPENVYDVKKAILNEYQTAKFKHLLIIGAFNAIPFYDEKGILGIKDDKGNIDDMVILDSVFYGDMDGDPFIELSVGRIPTSNPEEIKAYFEAVNNRAPAPEKYIYVAGREPIYRQQDIEEFEGKNLDTQELNNAFIRKQFLYTGYSPGFDGGTNGFAVAEDVPNGSKVFDDFSNCGVAGVTGFSFAFHKACDPNITDYSSGLNAAVFTKNGAFEDTIKSYIYSTLSQKIPGQFKAGESFKDYLNLAIASGFNEAEKYYALYGDPSNIVRTDGALFNTFRKVNMKLEEEQIKLEMPKLNLNDFFFLGKDKPFTAEEIENIKNGKFAVADATILGKDSPFVTEAEKDTSQNRYTLMLDDNLDADTPSKTLPILMSDKTIIKAMEKPEKVFDSQNASKISDFKRAILEINELGSTAEAAEVLSRRLDKALKTTETIDGNEYIVQTIELTEDKGARYTQGAYPNFLDIFGTIEIKENADNTVNVTAKISNLERVADKSLKIDDRLLYPEAYRLVLEEKGTENQMLIGLPLTPQEKQTGEMETGGYNLTLKDEFDSVSLYAYSTKFGEYSFMKKPIITAKIRDEQGQLVLDKEIEMKNVYGFLQFPESTLTVKIYTPKDDQDNFSKALYKIEEVQNLRPLREDKVILLETSNFGNKGLTASVKATVDEILEQNPSLKERFPEPGKVLLLDGEWTKFFPGYFVENAYFFGNEITASPFRYPENMDFESVKNALRNSEPTGKPFKAQIQDKSTEIDADVYFSTDGDSAHPEDKDVWFGFQFDLNDLFTLIEKGASEANYYELAIDGFEGGFEKPPAQETVMTPPAPEEEKQTEQAQPWVSIEYIFVGASKLHENKYYVEKDARHQIPENKVLTAYFSTNIHPFVKAQLFIDGKLSGEQSFEKLSPTYGPGKTAAISTLIPLRQIMTQKDKINLFVKVITGEQTEYPAEQKEITLILVGG